MQLNQYVQGVADGGRERTTAYGGTADYTLLPPRRDRRVFRPRIEERLVAWWQTSPRYLDIRAVYAFPIQPLSIFLSSSAVERSAVNRLVVGSNPTSGAKQLYRLARRDSATSFGIRTPGFEPSAARQTDRRSARRVRHSRITPTSGAKQLYRLARRDSATSFGIRTPGFEPSAARQTDRRSARRGEA